MMLQLLLYDNTGWIVAGLWRDEAVSFHHLDFHDQQTTFSAKPYNIYFLSLFNGDYHDKSALSKICKQNSCSTRNIHLSIFWTEVHIALNLFVLFGCNT